MTTTEATEPTTEQPLHVVSIHFTRASGIESGLQKIVITSDDLAALTSSMQERGVVVVTDLFRDPSLGLVPENMAVYAVVGEFISLIAARPFDPAMDF